MWRSSPRSRRRQVLRTSASSLLPLRLLVHLASTRPDLAADDHCLSLLLSRLCQPEDVGWRRDSIIALLGAKI